MVAAVVLADVVYHRGMIYSQVPILRLLYDVIAYLKLPSFAACLALVGQWSAPNPTDAAFL